MINLKNIFDENPVTPLQVINDPFIKLKGIKLIVKRLDKVHPNISGNKWFKLKYNIKKAIGDGFNTILTFGGAYSNHIYSIAAVGKIFNLHTIGIIRGEKNELSNSTLAFADKSGMMLNFVDRETYKNYRAGFGIDELKSKFGKFYLIPEGGTNILAVKGCKEIIDDIETHFDFLCCPIGTGGTLAGLICGLNGSKKIIGYAVLKGEEFLSSDVKLLVRDFSGKTYHNWLINYDYHFGGYAKTNTALIDFTQKFSIENNLPIEPIYTGKMFYGIYHQIKNNKFPPGSTIIALHTGGLRP